jgi:hypothetical protein
VFHFGFFEKNELSVLDCIFVELLDFANFDLGLASCCFCRRFWPCDLLPPANAAESLVPGSAKAGVEEPTVVVLASVKSTTADVAAGADTPAAGEMEALTLSMPSLKRGCAAAGVAATAAAATSNGLLELGVDVVVDLAGLSWDCAVELFGALLLEDLKNVSMVFWGFNIRATHAGSTGATSSLVTQPGCFCCA